MNRKVTSLLHLYNIVCVIVTSSHKPANKFLVCVGNRICWFDVNILVLLSLHLM